jgi:hypothetical protein
MGGLIATERSIPDNLYKLYWVGKYSQQQVRRYTLDFVPYFKGISANNEL